MAETPLFTVHRSELLPALIAAASAVDKSSKIDILQNIMLQPDGHVLRLRATDMTIEIETTCELLRSASNTPITLYGNDLENIVKSLPESAEIHFLPAQFPDRVRIQAGKSKFTLLTLPAEGFPSISDFVKGNLIPMDIAALVTGIARVLYAVSRAKDRVCLCGVFVHANVEGSHMTMVGCDGVSLAVYKSPLAGARDFGSFLLPTKAAEVIKRLFSDKKAPAEIIVNDAGIQLRCDGIRLTSKIVDAVYPDYNSAIPGKNEKQVLVSKSALASAISRVCLVSGDLNKDALQLAVKTGAIEISIACMDGERAAEEIAADYDGEPVSIGFHGKILGKTLESIHTTDVSISLHDHATAGLFKPTLDDSEIYVLMPKKIAPHEQVRGGS